MLKFAVLGSGSAGNAAILEFEGTRLLIDAGLSAKQICVRLEALQVSPDSLDAILLTHEHIDHIAGIDVFLKARKVPVFTTAHTREAFEYRLKRSQPQWRIFRAGEPFEIGPFHISPFNIPHDAADPVGYRIETQHHRLAYLSDVGHATAPVREAIKGVDLAYLETNYDEQLLAADMRRPPTTKSRIGGRYGHLSNRQAAQLLEEVSCERLKALVIGHLSSDCNEAGLATECIQASLTQRGIQAELHCSQQLAPTPWVQLPVPKPPAPPTTTAAVDQAEFPF